MTVTTNKSDELAKREDLVTLTIDDVEVSVPKGTLVIRAAELVGVDIPRFCDHPLLDLCDNILGRSFCALGDGATSPITSAIKFFREEFEAAMHTPAWELFPYERSTIFVREPAAATTSAGAH